MAKITVVPLFLKKRLSAGDSGTSDPIDMRYISTQQRFCVHYNIAGGTSTTAGTTTFSYVGCSLEAGTFVSPQNFGTFGTSGTGKTEAAMMTFGTAAIALTPFMKIIATQTGTGTAGAQSVLTAELIVQ